LSAGGFTTNSTWPVTVAACTLCAVKPRSVLQPVTARAAFFGMILALLMPQPASARDGHHEGKNRAFSGCVRGITRYGAYVELNARMSVNWKSSQRAIVDFAYNESTVNECGPSGYQTPGGQLRFHTRLEFIGDQIENCWAGCNINPHHTHAVYEFSDGPHDNTDGRGSLKYAGGEVNTGRTGHIYSVKFITRTTLSKGPDSATAQTTVDLHY
jgi:hypothetical protein